MQKWKIKAVERHYNKHAGIYRNYLLQQSFIIVNNVQQAYTLYTKIVESRMMFGIAKCSVQRCSLQWHSTVHVDTRQDQKNVSTLQSKKLIENFKKSKILKLLLHHNSCTIRGKLYTYSIHKITSQSYQRYVQRLH